jgi:naphthalene 1,2-dioxygenase system ferredoxin subunit
MNSIEVPAADVPQKDGDSLRVSEGPHDIALFRVGEELRATDNACPHYGASLSDGWIEDGVVACPWHCWQFDTKSGECLSVAGADVKVYAVEIEDGKTIIRVDEAEAPDAANAPDDNSDGAQQ